MNISPCPHQKSFRFCIEDDAAIATLESVLAIVRRLGIELRSLRTTACAGGMDVQIRLASSEEDALTLCRMRLHNAIGVLTIREMPALAASGRGRREDALDQRQLLESAPAARASA